MPERQVPTAQVDGDLPVPADGPGEDRNGAIVLALRSLQEVSATAQRALAQRLGVGITDIEAMDHILKAESPLGPVELGHRLGIRSASATVLVDRLEQAGHLTRTEHPHDRRRRVLQATDHARTEVLAALQPMLSPLMDAVTDLTDPEAQTVQRFLERVIAAYARLIDDGPDGARPENAP